jgi:bacillopeptidase F
MASTALQAAISILLVLAVALPSGPADGTDPAGGDNLIRIEAPLLPELIIAPEVLARLETDSPVEVLVRLTHQVDTKKAALAALGHQSASQRERLLVRTAVVEALRANALESQQGILRYLEREREQGRVLAYKSFYIVNVVYVRAAPTVIAQLARRGDVGAILPNAEIPLDLPGPEETQFGMDPQAVEWGLSGINAPAVWNLGVDGSGVVVGIVDSGVYWQHEALKERWRGYNPADPDNPDPAYNWYDATLPASNLPKDVDGHGTHVTGTVLGLAGENRIGVAPGARWIAARIFGDDGKSTTLEQILQAGQYLIAPTDAAGLNPRPDLAPDIVNNSWGGSDTNETLRQMVQAWRDAQILPVFAAGNTVNAGPGSILAPARYPESFAVAAVDSSNRLASFSCRGPSAYGEMIKPEISAPGVSVRSSLPGDAEFPNGRYGSKNGTSMAAPHVAGTAALMLSANPNLSVEQLIQMLEDTAVPLTDTTYPDSPNYGYGYGLVDALAAVNAARMAKITGYVLVPGQCGENGLSTFTWLPETAVLTVLETGYAVQTDPVDGSYRLPHPPGGPLTLQVQADGYDPQSRIIALQSGEVQQQNFFPGIGLFGNLNGDGRVDVGDAVMLLRHIVSLHPLACGEMPAADVNLDNRIDVSDAILILRHLVGLEPSLPAGSLPGI